MFSSTGQAAASITADQPVSHAPPALDWRGVKSSTPPKTDDETALWLQWGEAPGLIFSDDFAQGGAHGL